MQNFWDERGRKLSKGEVDFNQATTLTASAEAASRRHEQEWLVISSVFYKYLSPGMGVHRLLDLGGGCGRLAFRLANMFYEVVVVDYSKR